MGDRKYRHRGYMDDSDERERPRSKPAQSQRERVDGAPRGRGVGAPKDVVFRCAVCGERIRTLQTIEAEARCTSCGKPLHTCTNCAHFDSGARLECRKPIPARIESKTKANQCPHYQPKTVRDLSAKGPATPDDARSAFDALFKKS